MRELKKIAVLMGTVIWWTAATAVAAIYLTVGAVALSERATELVFRVLINILAL